VGHEPGPTQAPRGLPAGFRHVPGGGRWAVWNDQRVVSERVKTAVTGMLVGAVSTSFAAGMSSAPLTAGHLVLLATSVVAAGGVASLAAPASKKSFVDVSDT
jgi:hypothetical protein